MDDKQMQNPRKLEGTVTGDPAAIPRPFGTAFTFESLKLAGVLVKHDGSVAAEPMLRPTEVNINTCNGALLGICLDYQSSCDMIGTAFIIGPGLAVTAKHVLEDHHNNLEKGAFRACLVGIQDDKLTLWEICAIAPLEEQDIAFLSIVPMSGFPKNNRYYCFELSTAVPRQGEKIRLLGFRQKSSQGDLRSTQVYSGVMDMFTSDGVVKQFYPRGRDSTFLPSACFELDCNALRGMSGGVAINSAGRVVGVVSTSLDSNDGHETTFVSWIVSSFRCPIKTEWPQGAELNSSLLQETFRQTKPSNGFFVHNPNRVLNTDGSLSLPPEWQ